MREKILENKKKEKVNFDKLAHPLPPLKVGQRVAIRSRVDKDWSLRGKIIEVRPHRTYVVKSDTGSVLVRNRRYLREISQPATTTICLLPNFFASEGGNVPVSQEQLARPNDVSQNQNEVAPVCARPQRNRPAPERLTF